MNSQNSYEQLVENYNKDSKFRFRTLEEEDYHKQYFALLSQLTVADKPEWQDWVKRFNEMKSTNLMKIFVCEFEQEIIASVTCAIELKFIRNLGSICHIEDFVIDEKQRRVGLGSKLLNLAKEYARSLGCYKILLDSKDEVQGFYEKNGFNRTSNGMTIYFKTDS